MSEIPFLPLNFETRKKCTELRADVWKAQEQQLPIAQQLDPDLRRCTKKRRCMSGLCPKCVRHLRKQLLQFVWREKLHRRRWYFVTIFVDGWTKPPGDFTQFGPLRDHPLIKALLGRLRRRAKGQLLILGSIETVYKTVANVPTGKPFHLHFLISGISEAKIKRAVKDTFILDPKVAVPLLAVPVKRGRRSFLNTASYAFKQTFWKAAYPDPDSRRAHKQFPKRKELAELIANLGAHPVNGRLVMVGMRFDQGSFRLTKPQIGDAAKEREKGLETCHLTKRKSSKDEPLISLAGNTAALSNRQKSNKH